MVFTSSGPSRGPIAPVSKHPSFLALAVSGEAGLLLLAWALGRALGISPLELFRPSVPALVWGIAATGPLLIALAWMLTTRRGPIRRLVNLVVDQLGPLVATLNPAALALVAVLAGLSEEVLFRGIIQPALTRIVPEVWALLLTSVAFGLIHFASRAYAILAGLMGLYLGTLFLIQGSLLAPIVTHALYDFVALIYVARRYRATRPEPALDSSSWMP